MNAYLRRDPFSDPGRHAPAMLALDGDIGSVLAVVRGLLIHDAYLGLYGVSEADFEDVSRATLPVALRLNRVLERDGGSIASARPPGGREIGTCRDFALLTCALLRCRGVPARVRCGFARYFTPGRFEDHWVCEYRHAARRRWARADAQLDRAHREHLGIAFDATDMPAGEFLAADEAWRHCRGGTPPADAFGHGAAAGEWFLWVNLARDYLVLGNQVTSDWDTWRDAASLGHALSPSERAQCDAIAARIEATDDEVGVAALPFALEPFWRRSAGAGL